MQRKVIVTGLLAAGLIAFASVAVAAQPPVRHGTPAHPGLARLAQRSGHLRERLKHRIDADHNGQVSADEKAAAKEKFAGAREKMKSHALERFDANKDGTLSADEKIAAKQAFKSRLATMKSRFGALKAEMLKKFDADGDGNLSGAEREAAKQMIKGKIKAHGAGRVGPRGEKPESAPI